MQAARRQDGGCSLALDVHLQWCVHHLLLLLLWTPVPAECPSRRGGWAASRSHPSAGHAGPSSAPSRCAQQGQAAARGWDGGTEAGRVPPLPLGAPLRRTSPGPAPPAPERKALTLAPSLLQVHRGAGREGDLRQHPRAGEQAAAAVPAVPRHHAVGRGGSQGVDPGVPAPIPPPPLELQHPGPGPHRLRQGHAEK